jgi:epsilon-lactone hydrolase
LVNPSDEHPGLEVPPRVIPVPTTISREAQAMLALGPMPAPEYPALDDADGWRRMIAATDQAMLSMWTDAGLASPDGFEFEELTVDGVRVFVITPDGLDPDDRRTYLDIHGGAFIVGGGDLCRVIGTMTAAKLGMRVWTVDYRMPPDHPFPAGLDDCVVAYRALLQRHGPEEIVVGGTSAGGTLSAALVLRARDEGLPIPAVAILLTPGTDLTQSSDTFRTNAGVDTILRPDAGEPLLLYAGGHDLRDPYVSPVYGDFTKGFPPTLLASGTRDLLLSDTVRLHRALRGAGILAELHVLEAAPHGFFRGQAPEDRELDREVTSFIDLHCPAGVTKSRGHI